MSSLHLHAFLIACFGFSLKFKMLSRTLSNLSVLRAHAPHAEAIQRYLEPMWASEEEAEDAIEADPELYKSSWI